jgi:signal peptidase I
VKARRLVIEFLEVVGLAAVLFLTVHFAVAPVVVSGTSMYPTVTNNEYLVALRFPYYLRNPGRGDIVIMQSPCNPDTDFIKRVVGLPGETILIKDGTVYINVKVLCEPYLRPQVDGDWAVDASWPANGKPYHLSSTQYFVMGDNRNVSEDSRIFGPVQLSSILAEAWLRVYPIRAFGGVDPQRGFLSSAGTPSAAACAPGG